MCWVHRILRCIKKIHNDSRYTKNQDTKQIQGIRTLKIQRIKKHDKHDTHTHIFEAPKN